MPATTAITAASVVASIGVNTHIDFAAYGYQNLAVVEAAINYLGVKNLRDSPANTSDLQTWQQVAQATGARFDAFIGETSPAGMQTELGYISQLARQGVLNFIEGGNEEDDAYPQSLGNNLQITAQFQQQVWSLGQQLGLPVINMSFGAGWTAANQWHGNYDKVGNLSAYANYANAHTYPNADQTTAATIQRLNGDAQLAAAGRPVITTEVGWNTAGQGAAAQGVVQAVLDGIQNGDAGMYFYALFNDSSGNYGLMNADGSPTPAGTALHDLTSLLADNGGNFTPGSLGYSLSGQTPTDNTLLMQKSDGSYWLSLWDESAGTHNVTVHLAATASQIQVFDPVTGTSAIASASNANNISVSLGADPLLIKIVPSGSTSGSAGSSTGSGTASTTGTAPPPATATSPATPTPPAAGTTAAAGPDPVLTVPASLSASPNTTTAVSGVSLADPWAAGNPGTLALNVTASGGAVSMHDSNGSALSGSGTSTIHVSGTLAQINADLATLSYTAGSGSGSIGLNVWDQLGAQDTKTIGVTPGNAAGNGAAGNGNGAATTTAAPAISIAANDPNPVENVSNTTIGATAGDHMIFLGGTGDTLTATGGTESVQAYQGGSTITTGGGNDTIRYAGANNVVDAGAGNNTLYDSGTNNTIVLPAAGQGYDDIYGNLMTNGDKFDMRNMLAGTGWNGDMSTIGDFVSVSQSGTNTVINVAAAGTQGGSLAVATLQGTGPVTLTTLLTHAIT